MTIKDLAKALIQVPSTKDHKDKLHEALDVAKKELEGFTIEEFESKGIPSILVYTGDKRPEKFKVLLNAHLDVVPGREDQYHAKEENGKLHGRGALDMKSAAAAMISVFKEIAKEVSYPLALQLVTDEETGGFDGTKYQTEKGIKADFAIGGETTNLNLSNKAKGILWIKIIFKGHTGHAAYAWNGKNAVWEAKHFLDKLEEVFPEPTKEEWITTANVARIETTNQTFNKIPDECSVYLDIRYIPEDTGTIEEKVKNLLPKDAAVEIVEKEPSQFTDTNNSYVVSLSQTIQKITGKQPEFIAKHGGSDIRHLNGAGTPGVLFGPIGVGMHADEEWVDIKSLEDYSTILKEFLLSL